MKALTKILLILNPIAGFLIISFIVYGKWYLVPFVIIGVVLNIKLYLYTHKEEFDAYEAWFNEYSKKNIYLGEYQGSNYWKNIETNEVIEM